MSPFWKQRLHSLKSWLTRVNARKIYFMALVTGCCTGGVAILFHVTLRELSRFLFTTAAPFPPLIVLLPALGGLGVGFIAHRFAPEATGTGVDTFLDSFHNRAGVMRKRTAPAKFITSILTIATGGSAGKEGPMALIGAGIGSLWCKIVKMGARAQRTLLIAGAAGGLGAIFRAPLGGAITSVEVLYKDDFESDALIPAIISSVTAYTVFSSVMGFSHNLAFHTTIFHSPIELFFYAGLGLFCSGAGYLFIRLFRGTRNALFARLTVPKPFVPAIGGLFIGIFALLAPDSVGEGLHIIQRVIDGNMAGDWIEMTSFFLGLALLKMLTTSITIQSGGSGGALIPSLFIGAMLGGAFGTVCHHFFPTLVPEVTPFIIVGMASFFSAVTNASLGALVMVTEFTGGYELLPPLMTVAVISLITSRKFSIYRYQVKDKFSTEAHLWDINVRGE